MFYEIYLHVNKLIELYFIVKIGKVGQDAAENAFFRIFLILRYQTYKRVYGNALWTFLHFSTGVNYPFSTSYACGE